MSKYSEALDFLLNNDCKICKFNAGNCLDCLDAREWSREVLQEAIEKAGKWDESIVTLKTPYQVMCLHLEQSEKENKILKDGVKALLSLSMYGTSIEELLNVAFDYRKLEEQKDIIRYEKIRAMQEVVKDEEI